MPDGERLLTTQEVSDQLRVHIETVRKWVRTGRLRAIKLGPRSGNRIRESDLERFLAMRTTEQTEGMTKEKPA